MPSINQIQSIRRRIERPAEACGIQIEILDLISDSLRARKEAFGEWEKVHFSNAITALALSIHKSEQPPHKWLERCLRDLEKAITPVRLRESTDRIPDGSVRKARHEQFTDALECLRLELTAESASNTKVA